MIEQEVVKNGGSFMQDLWPVCTLGLENSLTPCLIALALIFFIYCSRYADSTRKLIVLGLIYILVLIASQGLLVLGLFDLILTGKVSALVIRGVVMAVSLVFILMGFRQFSIWRKAKAAKETEVVQAGVPAFYLAKERSSSEVKSGIKTWIWYLLIGIAWAMVSVVVGSVYSYDYESFVYFWRFQEAGQAFEAFSSLVLYSACSLLPVFLIWIGAGMSTSPGKLTAWMGKISGLLRMVYSAILLATGFGLLYVFRL